MSLLSRAARCALTLGLLVAAGCSSPAGTSDGGTPDAGLTGPACDSPDDCRAAGYDGACRQSVCRARVPCAEDVECALGESCVAGNCRFTGCAQDADCPVGKCRKDVYACTECGVDADCPSSAPVCTGEGKCVACKQDSDCTVGPGYCEADKGACVFCKKDEHCANGLSCGADGTCHGAQLGQGCGGGVSCDLGLICVTVNNVDQCMKGCSLYTPACAPGQICLKLTFSGSASLVFDRGEPQGVCFQPLQGLKGYRDSCAGNCQPNLECVPDSASQSFCRAYCNPNKPVCEPGEQCHPFPGDFSGHSYGLCYRDSGFGERCASEAVCRAGLSCAPAPDPSVNGGLSNACRFSGVAADGGTTAPPLAPCSQNAQCATKECRSDSTLGLGRYFCFGACQQDSDCAVGGRTGTCDGTFDFPSGTQTVAVPGCRPRCSAPAACAEYGAGYSCGLRVQLPVGGGDAKLNQLCAPVAGSKRVGESCTQSSECREGYCYAADARGHLRQGVCTHPCALTADCAAPLADGGISGAGLTCEHSALVADPGRDGVAGTFDDLIASAYLCGGKACQQAGDCAAPLSVCAPDTTPTAPLGPSALRCRAPSFGGTGAAGAPCAADNDCVSGACAELNPPLTGRACFEPCVVGGPACPGALTCQPQAASLRDRLGNPQSFSACLP